MTDNLGAGLIAFLVVLALVVGCFFLFRSMLKHLRRVPAKFEEPREPSEESDVTSPPR